MDILNWREWLSRQTETEKKKLKAQIGVSDSSLSQWIHSDRRPRPRHLAKLIAYNPDLRASIEREFPDAFQSPDEGTELKIQEQVYEDILKTFAFTAEAVCVQMIAEKVFTLMSAQLDPGENGLHLRPAFCVVASTSTDKRITLLHSGDEYSTGVFRQRPNAKVYFDLGKDSLVGTAVMRRQPVLYPQTGVLDTRSFDHIHQQIGSAGAFPLWRRGSLAGALFVASVYSSFFTEARTELCARYADLFALSLYDHQFYNPQRIDLQVLREGIDSDCLT